MQEWVVGNCYTIAIAKRRVLVDWKWTRICLDVSNLEVHGRRGGRS